MTQKSFIKIKLELDDELIKELNELQRIKDQIKEDFEHNKTDWDTVTRADEQAMMICDVLIQQIQECPFESRLD